MENKQIIIKEFRKNRLEISFKNITISEARFLGFGNGIPAFGFRYTAFGDGWLVCDKKDLCNIFDRISNIDFDKIIICKNKIQ